MKKNVVYSKAEVGPLKWMAPECVTKKKSSEKSDVWSFGITCGEILTRKEPYPTYTAVHAATAVITEGLRIVLPENTAKPLQNLIGACFAVSPEDRPDFISIVSSLQTMQIK